MFLILREQINGKRIIQDRKIVDDRVIKNIQIANNGTKRNFMESVRLYTESELKSAIEKTGFRILNVFGDYNGNKFDLDSSRRIIIISLK